MKQILFLSAFYFVSNGVVYKTCLVRGKGDQVVYKMFIVNVVYIHAFVSNLKILTLSKVMDWHLLGDGYELNYWAWDCGGGEWEGGDRIL